MSSVQVDPSRIIKKLQEQLASVTGQKILLEAAYEQLEDQFNELQQKYDALASEAASADVEGSPEGMGGR